MRNPYSVRQRSRRAGQEYRFERALTFDLTVGSPSMFTVVSGRFFLGVDSESLLGDAEVSSLETRIPVRKGHNF